MGGIPGADVTMLRTTRHASQFYLAVYIPTVIWTARINGTQSNGDTTITVDGVLQVRAPQANYQVLFGSTAGARDLGEARFKSYAIPTLTVGAHNATLTDDAYVTILEFIPPTAIHPSISATDVVSEDGNIAFVSDNASKIPLARIGVPAVVWRDTGTGLGTINFFSDSVAIAPAATISTHAWDFRDGTPGTSALPGSTGAPIAVTFPSVGWRYISYAATDSNGMIGRRYNPVLVDDYVNPQYTHSQIELGPIEVNEQGAASVQVTVHTNAGEAAFPECAQVIIFSDDYFDDTNDYASLYPHRENVVMAGYIRAGSTRFNALHSIVEFRVDSLSAIASNLINIGGGLEDNTTPTGWHQIKNLTYNLAAHHILTHHSTLSQIADVHVDLNSFASEYIDLTDSFIADNLKTQMAEPTAGKFGCSLQGEIWLQPNPQLLALASRSTDYSINLTTADLRDEVEFGDQTFENQTSQVDLVCDKADGDAWYSIAPEFQEPFGQYEHVEGYRADSQAAANILSGMLLGSRNNSPKETILRTRGNYRFLQPFPIQPITATFAAATNARGTVWSSQRCWVNRASLQYANGKLLVDVTVEKDSSGLPGITGDYPVEIPPPIYVPPPIKIEPPPPPPPPPPNGKGNRAFIPTLKGLAMVTGAYDYVALAGPDPVWSSLNGSTLLGDALKIRAFNLDPWSVVTDHFTAGWAMTDDGFYRVTGLPDAPVWTQQLTVTAAAALVSKPVGECAFAYGFNPSVRLAGFVAVVLEHTIVASVSEWFVVYSLDYGATWAANVAFWVGNKGDFSGGSYDSGVWFQASSHLDDIYYLGPGTNMLRHTSDHAGEVTPYVNVCRSPGYYAGSFPHFSEAMTIGNGIQTVRIYFPYCNTGGTVYADDAVMYAFYISTGMYAIGRFTNAFNPLWSPGYTPTVPIYIGDAAMGTINTLFGNIFNEDIGVATEGNASLWFSQNMAQVSPTWTQRSPSMFAGGQIKYLFCIPIDENIVFIVGSGSSGVARCAMTIDFGANWTRIDNPAGGTLDSVMGLVAGDMVNTEIIVDYYQP